MWTLPDVPAATICSSRTAAAFRYLDCSKVPLPFGPQFVSYIIERTSVAQDQEGALLAAELVLTAQARATRL